MHHGPSDTEVLSRVLNGDQNAYALLVDRYRNFVFTIVLKYVKNREDAEEIAQDTFIKAYRSLADFKGLSKFSTWLYRIATTTSITFLRKKKPEVHPLDHDHIYQKAINLDGGLHANIIEQKNRQSMVRQAIERLGEGDAQVLLLFYNAEQNLDDIAQIMGKETNAVKVQLFRARARLKELMKKQFKEEIKDIF